MTVSSLADKRCVPCLGGTPPLTPAEIAPLLAQVEGWTVEANKRLIKPFKFKNFVQAVEFVNACLTNDLGRIMPGKAQYTLCCDESGGVVDDLIAYLVDADEVFLVPNAANNAATLRTKNLRRIIAPRGWQKSALFEPFPQLRRVFRQFWHGSLRSPLAEHEPFYQAPPFAAVFHRSVGPALDPKRSW